MAQEYPRVGDWILLSHIEGSESQFVAVSNSTGKKEAIKIESKRPRHAGIGGGLELILWSGGKKLVLEMPLYNITGRGRSGIGLFANSCVWARCMGVSKRDSIAS